LPKPEARRLGKGLGALLGEYLEEPASGKMPIREIEVGRIRPNPFQPRRQFEGEALAELEASIKENGLLQPLVVRPSGLDFELVAGERRWRVLTRLGWEKAPTIVRPLEVAQRVGRDRSTVANALRLLTLPAAVRGLLSEGAISAGHARAILSVEGEADQVALAREVAAKGLSVRETESRARTGKKRGTPGGKRGPAREDPVARKAAVLLSRAYGTNIKVKLHSRSRGEIRIPFHDADDFERVTRELLDAADVDELFGER